MFPMKFHLSMMASAVLLSAAATPTLASPSFESISKLWSTTSSGLAGVTGNSPSLAADYSSEISAWDPLSRSIFVAGGKGIEVLSLTGSVINSWETTKYGEINSIAISDGVAAVSFANSANKGLAGSVQFFNTGLLRTTGTDASLLGSATVGSVPDMVTWTGSGANKRLLVANEGERQATVGGVLGPNAAGSISIVNFGSTAPATFAVGTVNTLGFTATYYFLSTISPSYMGGSGPNTGGNNANRLGTYYTAYNPDAEIGSLAVAQYSASAPSAVPIPAAAWLMASGLGALGVAARKRRAKAA
jgi:hypothetical protein